MQNHVERQWTVNTARRTARRWRKEREMQEQQKPVVIMEDELVHSDAHPFCTDDSCPCHTESEQVNELVSEPFSGGLLTVEEAKRLLYDRQV